MCGIVGSVSRSGRVLGDLIEGIVRLLASDEVLPTNIGNPREMTILEFARAVIELCDSGSKIEFRELPVDDPRVRQPDITKARAVLGWEPQVDLRTGLDRTLSYFRQRLERS